MLKDRFKHTIFLSSQTIYSDLFKEKFGVFLEAYFCHYPIKSAPISSYLFNHFLKVQVMGTV